MIKHATNVYYISSVFALMHEFRNFHATAFFSQQHALTVHRADDAERVLKTMAAIIDFVEERYNIGHYIRAQYGRLPERYLFVASPDGIVSVPVVEIEYVGGTCFKFTFGGKACSPTTFEEIEMTLFSAVSCVVPILINWRAIEKSGINLLATELGA